MGTYFTFLIRRQASYWKEFGGVVEAAVSAAYPIHSGLSRNYAFEPQEIAKNA